MKYQEHPESDPVIRVRPEICPVDFSTKSIFILKEMESTGDTPAGGNNSNTENKDTDAQYQYQPVNIYIEGGALKYGHMMSPF